VDNKAFKFELKSLDAAGTFAGMASVFGNLDLGNDVVDPGAFTRTLAHKNGEVPILFGHDQHALPVGLGKLQETPQGLAISGELALDTSRGQEVYSLMKRGILKGLSIGYDTVKSVVQNGVRHLQELKLYEVSIVTFPMNELATVSSVKAQGDIERQIAVIQACTARIKSFQF